MSQPRDATNAPPVQIDIISDVMCPWCIVGYQQLQRALAAVGVGASIRWHPFELNPQMPPEGQDLAEHIAEKYGASAQQSSENRERLTQIGQELGFDFRFSETSRIVNSFAAHQLLDWAETLGKQHALKRALFDAYFTYGQDVSDSGVLADIASSAGLDRDAAAAILASGSHADATRERQAFWTSRGISGVPAMVFDGRYLLTGAQGVETYTQMLQKVLAEKAAA